MSIINKILHKRVNNINNMIIRDLNAFFKENVELVDGNDYNNECGCVFTNNIKKPIDIDLSLYDGYDLYIGCSDKDFYEYMGRIVNVYIHLFYLKEWDENICFSEFLSEDVKEELCCIGDLSGIGGVMVDLCELVMFRYYNPNRVYIMV